MKNPIDFDRKHIWHPYTSAVEPLPTYEIVSAEGVRLTLANGKTLIDGMSSWWCAIHGYNHPTLNEAIQTEITKYLSNESIVFILKNLDSVNVARYVRRNYTPAGHPVS